MFKSIKTTSPHEVNLRTERIRNSGAQLFVPCLDFWWTRAPRRNMYLAKKILRIRAPSRVPEMNLSYLQKMPIYCPSGEYKLLIRFFLKYCATQSLFSHTIF